MISFFSRLVAIAGFSLLLVAPAFAALPAYAADSTGSGSGTSTANNDDCPAGVVCLYNPLGSTSDSYDIRFIIGRVIRGMLSIIGSLAFLMFIWGGVMWMTSNGNPERVKKGKDILVWAVAGLGIIFSSYAIVNAILNALTTGSTSG